MSTIHNDVDFYTKLWKIKYNINLENKFVLNDQFISFKKRLNFFLSILQTFMKTKKWKIKRNKYTRRNKRIKIKKLRNKKWKYKSKRKTKYGKNRKHRKKRIYTKKNYNSGDGMLVDVWGPSL